MAYRNYSTANGFIVDKLGNGDFLTIQAAVTAATSGFTIFIRPGTYTENVTMKAGLNITSSTGDGINSNVILNGTLSCSYSGSSTISNIQLKTNSANLISLTGANATVLNLTICFLNCTTTTGISSTGSNAASQIVLNNCMGNLATTGIGLFAVSNGSINFQNCFITNSGNSVTSSTLSSAATTSISSSQLNFPIAVSGTAQIGAQFLNVDVSPQNTTAIIMTSTNAVACVLRYARLATGTATPLTIGAGSFAELTHCTLNSTNTTAISGAGSLESQDLTQENTFGLITVTTQNIGVSGLISGTAPAAGYLGQIIISNVATPGVSLSTSLPANVTSITLTAGTWIITGVIVFSGVITGTFFIAASSTTTASIGTAGVDYIAESYASTGGIQSGVPIPAKIVTIATSTQYFLVADAGFTAGTVTAYGYIQGTRIA